MFVFVLWQDDADAILRILSILVGTVLLNGNINVSQPTRLAIRQAHDAVVTHHVAGRESSITRDLSGTAMADYMSRMEERRRYRDTERAHVLET